MENYPINPLVPRVQKIKIRKLTLNRLPIVEFVKKIVVLGSHYYWASGTNGLFLLKVRWGIEEYQMSV